MCCTSCLRSSDYAVSVLGQRNEYFSCCSLCHCSMKSSLLGLEASLLTRTQQFISVTTVLLNLISMCSPGSYLPESSDDVQKTTLNARASRKCATLFTIYWTLQERRNYFVIAVTDRRSILRKWKITYFLCEVTSSNILWFGRAFKTAHSLLSVTKVWKGHSGKFGE
jgi:hypothetical protein